MAAGKVTHLNSLFLVFKKLRISVHYFRVLLQFFVYWFYQELNSDIFQKLFFFLKKTKFAESDFTADNH